jgi:hypothetical protein
MADAEIAEKRDPVLRLPRQAKHYSQIVGHFLAVKNSIWECETRLPNLDARLCSFLAAKAIPLPKTTPQPGEAGRKAKRRA